MKELLHKDAFDAYRRLYCGGDLGHSDIAPVDKVLAFWQSNKQNLYKLMGEEFILSTPVSYDRPWAEMRSEMTKLTGDYAAFIEAYWRHVDCMIPLDNTYAYDLTPEGKKWYADRRVRDALYRLVYDGTLTDARVPDDIKWTSDDGEIVINIARGQKLMKALGKVCAIFNMEEDFENFRVAHSQVLNQKRLTGELCLSIHPLDYATASDNANNWSSCMSWRENGCYRFGTVEMMNSPMVICAYLKSTKNNMSWRYGHTDYEWPSKKWRAWILVHEGVILCNRQYPYDNDVLATQAVNWVKSLAQENLGWADYNTTEMQGHGFEFDTNFMYNDIQDEQICCLSYEYDGTRYINFSGPANCMWCGVEVEYDYDDRDCVADSLLCSACRGEYYCDECGDNITGREEEYVDPATGEKLCEHCFYERYTWCDECQEYISRDEVTRWHIPGNPLLEAYLLKPLLDNPEREDVRRAMNRWGEYTKNNNLRYIAQAISTSHEGSICYDCLRKMGLDPYEDELIVSRYMNLYSAFGGRIHPSHIDNLLNGAMLTYEQWLQLTDRPGTPSRPYFFPEQEEIQRKLFKNYQHRCLAAIARPGSFYDRTSKETEEEQYGIYANDIKTALEQEEEAIIRMRYGDMLF